MNEETVIDTLESPAPPAAAESPPPPAEEAAEMAMEISSEIGLKLGEVTALMLKILSGQEEMLSQLAEVRTEVAQKPDNPGSSEDTLPENPEPAPPRRKHWMRKMLTG